MATRRDSKPTEVILAGAAAAFTVDLLVYPLDTIKTRYQSQQHTSRSASVKGLPTSLFQGLYQGVGSVVIATLPAAGVFFFTYETAKSGFGAWLPAIVPQPAIHVLASGTAELASCVVLTPAEVIKQNAQVLRESASSSGGGPTSVRAFRMFRQSRGGLPWTLWSGYTALAARNLPFTALHFPSFEFLRGRLWELRDRQKSSQVAGPHVASRPIRWDRLQVKAHTREASLGGLKPSLLEVGAVTGAAAAASGAAAALITTPTDVVKTRMMLAASDRQEDGSTHQKKKKATGSLGVASDIFREQGFRGLFRGAALRMAWTALGSGLYLGSYEMAKLWLNRDSLEPGNVSNAIA